MAFVSPAPLLSCIAATRKVPSLEQKVSLRFPRRHSRPRRLQFYASQSPSSQPPSSPVSIPSATGPSWKTSQGSGAVLQAAARDAVRGLDLLHSNPPTLVLFFVAGARDPRTTPRIIRDEIRRARIPLDNVTVVGCTGEIARGDAFGEVTVQLSAAVLPGVRVHPWTVDSVDLDWRQEDWWKIVGCKDVLNLSSVVAEDGSAEEVTLESDAVGPVFLLLGMPELCSRDLLAGLDFAFPRSPKVGALAGAPVLAGDAYVFDADGNVCTSGVVGVALERTKRGTAFEVVVAQGARPVGPRVTITQVKEETEIVSVQELTGAQVSVTTAPMRLLEMWTEMGVLDKDDVQARMYLGVDIPSAAVAARTPAAASAFVIPSEEDSNDESGTSEAAPKADRTRSDAVSNSDEMPLGPPPGMLVRRVVGVDAETMSAAVSGPPVRLGVGARFHVRDAKSVEDELERLRGIVPLNPVGGVLFTDGARVELAAEMEEYEDERRVFGGSVVRLVGESEMGPLPAPGFQQYFPIREPGSAASTFDHSSCSVYLLVYDELASTDAESPEEK